MLNHPKSAHPSSSSPGSRLRFHPFSSLRSEFRDLRARLELSVDHMLDACSRAEYLTTTDDGATEEEDDDGHAAPEFLMNSPQVTAIARKEVAPALRDLIQHGLIQVRVGGKEKGQKSLLC